jgi:hypothetical protein
MSSDSEDDLSVGEPVGAFGGSVSSSGDSSSDIEGSDTELPAFVAEDNDSDVDDRFVEAARPEAAVAPEEEKVDVDPFAWMSPFADPGPAVARPPLKKREHKLRLKDEGVPTVIRTEMDAFLAFFTPPVLDMLCAQTSARLLARGKPVLDRLELFRWLAILFSMGVTRLPETKQYWATGSFGKQIVS